MRHSVHKLRIDRIVAVIFDCDGVMFNSSGANAAYYNRILAHFGLPVMVPDQLSYVHMHTVDESIRFLLTEDTLVRAAHRYRDRIGYRPFIKYMVMEPYLVECLESIRPQYKIAIATNRTDTMQRVLAENNLDRWFDIVVTALDVPLPKPHPHQLNAVLNHLKISPDQALFIGDSRLDEEAAKAAGIPFIAYKNALLSAHRHIDSFRCLESILCSQPPVP